MNFQMQVQALPLPALLNEPSALKCILGVGLFLIGALLFSMWRERLLSLKEDERMKFLMFNVVGGSWILAVFAVCGGLYFLCDSIFKFVA